MFKKFKERKKLKERIEIDSWSKFQKSLDFQEKQTKLFLNSLENQLKEGLRTIQKNVGDSLKEMNKHWEDINTRTKNECNVLILQQQQELERSNKYRQEAHVKKLDDLDKQIESLRQVEEQKIEVINGLRAKDVRLTIMIEELEEEHYVHRKKYASLIDIKKKKDNILYNGALLEEHSEKEVFVNEELDKEVVEE